MNDEKIKMKCKLEVSESMMARQLHQLSWQISNTTITKTFISWFISFSC